MILNPITTLFFLNRTHGKLLNEYNLLNIVIFQFIKFN